MEADWYGTEVPTRRRPLRQHTRHLGHALVKGRRQARASRAALRGCVSQSELPIICAYCCVSYARGSSAKHVGRAQWDVQAYVSRVVGRYL